MLQLLLDEAIYSSKSLGLINVSTEWQIGITSTGTRNRRNANRLRMDFKLMLSTRGFQIDAFMRYLRVGSTPLYIFFCCINLNSKLRDSLDNNFRRVAIKRFVIDSSHAQKENKFLIWCLDEVKHSLLWVESMGPVYELPDSLKPEVFPWLAMHIWYDKHIMNHPERLQQIMELYYESDDNQSHIDSNISQESFHCLMQKPLYNYLLRKYRILLILH